MKTMVLNVPTMYGDHHVIEARRIVLGLAGVQDVYASSYLKIIEVTFDPALLTEEDILAKLEPTGYLRELNFEQETGQAAYGHDSNKVFLRHTAAHVGKTVSFVQAVAERPLIPCPGMGQRMED